jgi:hypothetical protein
LGSTITTAGPVHIHADDRLNALIVQCSPADADTIQDLLEVLDQPESPADVALEAQQHVIPLANTQAEEVAEIVRSVFQTQMVTGSRGSTRGGPPDPRQMMEMMARMRGGGSTRGSSRGSTVDESEKMSIGVDTRTNSLIVRAPEPLFRQVEQLVRQLDEAALDSDPGVITTVDLKGLSAEALQQALSSMLGDNVTFGSSSSGSRRTGTTSRSGQFGRPSGGSTRTRGSGFSFGGRPTFGGPSSRGRTSSGRGR